MDIVFKLFYRLYKGKFFFEICLVLIKHYESFSCSQKMFDAVFLPVNPLSANSTKWLKKLRVRPFGGAGG